MKSNKSYLKRFRVTKRGKIIARAPGQNHFNAKDGGGSRQARRRKVSLHATMTAADKSRFFPRSK